MKTATTILVIALGMLLSVRGVQLPSDYENLGEMFADVFNQVRGEVPEFPGAAINMTNLTNILLGELGGFMSGLYASANDTNTIRCFDNIQNVTAVYNYVMNIINGGLPTDTIKMIRQILVLGVMLLNVTIEEWTYCQNITYGWYTLYGTAYCIIKCPSYYVNQLATKMLYNTFYYLYYFKEAYREFTNTNYHLSGNWLAYAFNSLILLYNQPCITYNGYCPNATISELDSRIADENNLM